MINHIQELEQRDNKKRPAYIKEILSKLEIPFHVQQVNGWLAKSENIIVDYPFVQTDLTETKKILLCAHHNKWFYSPGANDNASGVSVLIELLKQLQKSKPSDVYIRIVFFALEDGWGGILTGSRHYVKKYGTHDLDRVYNIDMVGVGDSLALWLPKNVTHSETWIKPLIDSAQKHHLPVLPTPFGGLSSLNIVDHMSFERNGFNKACTITSVYQDDIKRFKGCINPLKFLFYYLLRFDLFRKVKIVDIPKRLYHYHNKNDRSKFIEEEILKKILVVIGEAVAGKK
jgi:hypothetical protein